MAKQTVWLTALSVRTVRVMGADGGVETRVVCEKYRVNKTTGFGSKLRPRTTITPDRVYLLKKDGVVIHVNEEK